MQEERLVPVCDVVYALCDQVEGRLKYIQKFGLAEDMHTVVATLLYAAQHLDVEELHDLAH